VRNKPVCWFHHAGVLLQIIINNSPSQAVIDDIFEHIHKHNLHPVISKVFSLDEIGQAHTIMENNTANGKVIVKI
jgi:NADPH:quinone reductase-like Zn-dependent oxidoreductase